MVKAKFSACKNFFSLILLTVFFFTITLQTAFAQTTGKISGKVTSADTHESLIGANIILEGTKFGAATDINGEYYIINIPPGTYRLKVSMVGYETVIIDKFTVSVNRTSSADIQLKETTIQGKEVVISVSKIQSKKDQTSSVRNVTADEISMMPVENLDAVVNMQTGVVRGHFRGGRSDEVAYLVDGVKVDEAFGNSRIVTVEKNVVSEIEVITGTFNAEYGNAMSGVVNAVTKDGGNEYNGSISLNTSNFVTPHDDIFFGLKSPNLYWSKDFIGFLEGPIIQNYLNFIVNGRYQDYVGPRSGIRRFEPDNFSNFSSQESSNWYSEHTGDNAVVPMETGKEASVFGKISFNPSASIRMSLNYSYNFSEGQGYSHFYKYNPDARGSSHFNSNMLTFTINHSLSNSLFYEFKSSYLYSWDAYYKYENPLDNNYIHDGYTTGSNGPGFSTGGMDKGWSENWNKNFNEKFDISWQVSNNHIFKAGIDFTQYIINRFNTSVRNKYFNTPFVNDTVFNSQTGKTEYLYYEPELILENSIYTQIYEVRPRQYSAYLQDKMEFDEMVINLGLRFDYFNPNTTYPSQYRNPGNQLSFPDNPDKMSTYLKAEGSSQLSPRFGISYKLGDAALLRFSYGHFFQMPPLYALYANHYVIIGTGDYQTLLGNPRLKPQKTIQYEAGLWQQLTSNMSCEVAVFYRDIYDLLSTTTIETYNAIRYGLYTNKDYGNARGLELKFDYYSGPFTARVNYTLQYTRGVADYPTFSFDRAGAKLDPVTVLVPMAWDQRHTLNATVSYFMEGFGISATARYDSGTPYGWSPLAESDLARVHLNPNNSTMPSLFSVDLQGSVDLFTFGSTKTRMTLLVYNLLDRLNEVSVNSTTGRANQVIIRETTLAGYRSNFSTVYDLNNNPGSFSNPRSVKIGIEFIF